MTDPRVFRALQPDQADGLACVVCRTSLLAAPAGARFVPVGRGGTGSQVHACADPRPCAGQLGFVARDWQPGVPS